MQTGIRELTQAQQAQIFENIEALARGERNDDGWITCPLLDRDLKICLVYEHRPAACRMYGFYVARNNNQWCNDIQALYDQGALDGVTFGNYSAINRELNKNFGEVRSLMEWIELADLQPEKD